ncbi:7179_t:CDS:2, partial [Acaulospora morrowiae]
SLIMTLTTENCHVIADLCIVPVGKDVSTSKYIIEVQNVLQETGLKTNLHACGTNIEGKFDQIMSAIQKCINKVHELGVARIDTTIRLQTRTDKSMTIKDSINAVNEVVPSKQ